MEYERSFTDVEIGDTVRIVHPHRGEEMTGPVYSKFTDEGTDTLIIGTAAEQFSAPVPENSTVTVVE